MLNNFDFLTNFSHLFGTFLYILLFYYYLNNEVNGINIKIWVILGYLSNLYFCEKQSYG